MSRQSKSQADWCHHEYYQCEDDCAIRPAENRLREVHRWWHACADGYLSPDDFRESLNSAVQALRNATFNLQSAKSKLPGFDDWYSGHQQAMKADPVLRWIVEARNTIVKQGELETHSQFKAGIIVGYDDEAAFARSEHHRWEELIAGSRKISEPVQTEPPALMSLHVAHEKLRSLKLPKLISEDATILYEREWVVDRFPQHELLMLLAHAYGKIRQIVVDGHRLISQTNAGSRPLSHEGKRPCMTSTRHFRSARFRFIDEAPVSQYKSFDVALAQTLDEREKLEVQYGKINQPAEAEMGNLQSPAQMRYLVDWSVETATQIVQSGQEHGWFTFYYRHGAMVSRRVHMATDAQGKRAIASEIARLAVEKEASTVLCVSEMWMNTLRVDQEGSLIPPAKTEDRGEGIAAFALSRSGAAVSMYLPFEKVEGEPPNRSVVLGSPFESDSDYYGIFWPLASVWGLV